MTTQVMEGIDRIALRLRDSLVDYIEASHHIRHADIVGERRLLLEREGIVAQRPFIESTPGYKLGPRFEEIGLPAPVADTLAAMTMWSSEARIFERPYLHQANSLRRFFNDGLDLIVTTGTGSGKTESFLWPILGSLVQEAVERPDSFAHPGIRALILYPTNALVGDQLSRLRRLFGSQEMRTLFLSFGGRVPTFGTYTSRTLYAGEQSDKRNKEYIGRLIEYFVDVSENNPDLEQALRRQGRWPAKDLFTFKKTGFKTGSLDSELLSRHEMQESAPDILVTNYSMLEYMLIRPVERSIFEQTTDWILSDQSNRFLFVLDEAHLYRGSSGTEVGLLARRLLARVGLTKSKDRSRFILSSASLGDSESALRFASDLTGKSVEAFSVIVSEREERPPDGIATREEGVALTEVADVALGDRVDTNDLRKLDHLGDRLSWPPRPKASAIAEWLYEALYEYPPLNFAISSTTDGAVALADLASIVFPENGAQDRVLALNALLALGSYARKNDRPLLPARVHMMFRGIGGLYACIDPNCTERLSRGDNSMLGALYTEPRVACACGSRVFEMFSHADCGAVFLRCFHETGRDIRFLWHEQGAEQDLEESFLLVGKPHPQTQVKELETLHVHLPTGRTDRIGTSSNTIQLHRVIPQGREKSKVRRFGVPFGRCPVCRKSNQSRRIQPFATTGETPFGTLVREQFSAQPVVSAPSKNDPNGGKKALLFADGRQRSARLARDLPREVEFAAFRGAIVLAWQRLEQIGRTQSLNPNRLYAAFVSVCSDMQLTFFDSETGDDQRLAQDIFQFEDDYESSLDDFVDEMEATSSFRRGLLRQLADPRASLSRSCIAVPELSRRVVHSVTRQFSGGGAGGVEELIHDYMAGWLMRYLSEGLVDQQLQDEDRRTALPNWERPNDDVMRDWRVDGIDCRRLNIILRERCLQDDVLSLNDLTLTLALDAPWRLCGQCGHLQDHRYKRLCLNCASSLILEVSPDSHQLLARIRYWRQAAVDALALERITTINVEEHSAQLSYRDRGRQFATSEEHELRFLGLPIGDRKRPIDILSCTTTMEVGIDIGSLTAVGMRNIPPRRDNYQQRAGRAGRRGSSLSTVVSYGQNGPHDSYYFQHPEQMIRGDLVPPRIQRDNVRLARRHFNAWGIQTYFHEQAARHASSGRYPKGLFLTLGSAHDFFSQSDAFSFVAFEKWLRSRSPEWLSAELSWLPEELRVRPSETIDALTEELARVAKVYTQEGSDDAGLLDVLFNNGLLPSYAFPTDVVSLTIFDGHGNMAEQPQMSRVQALSEYAPGRTVVVNKKTYRIGGLYDPFTQANDVVGLLATRSFYHYCHNCTYVRKSSEGDHSKCPVCGEQIEPMPMIEPPGFAPVDARPLRENDTAQTYSSARHAQLPIPNDALPSNGWIDGPGGRMMRYYQRDQELLVANVGDDDRGFAVCEKCGAIRAVTVQPLQGGHNTPYPVRVGGQRRAQSRQCHGSFSVPVALGTSFLSDVLLLRVSLQEPIETEIRPWLVDAFWSASEAVTLAASRLLDIDSSELSAGFRFLTGGGKGTLSADIYLYDTAAGGAGYSYAIGHDEMLLQQLLKDARELLRDCPGRCERSCRECLKNYRNQFQDLRLDRHLGLALLDFVMDGKPPAVEPERGQALLAPLREFLNLEGRMIPEPIEVKSILLAHPLSAGRGILQLTDYKLLRDLPGVATSLKQQPVWRHQG